MSVTARDLLMKQLEEQVAKFQQQPTQATAPSAPAPQQPSGGLGQTLQTAVQKGVAGLAGLPIDAPSMVANYLGISDTYPDATRKIEEGLSQATGIPTEFDENDLTSDLVGNFTKGFVETAPYGGPAAIPVGIAGGLSQVILSRDFFDDKPLAAFTVGVMLPGAVSPFRGAKPRADFDPRRPLTEAEAQPAGTLGRDFKLAEQSRYEVTPDAGIQKQLALRSGAFEKQLMSDLGLPENTTGVLKPTFDVVSTKLREKTNSLRARLSKLNDKDMGNVPTGVKLPVDVLSRRINDLRGSKEALSSSQAQKALGEYLDEYKAYRTVDPRELHEEMKLLGEVAFGNIPFQETAFAVKYPEIAKTLSEAAEETRRSFAKKIYANLNDGIGDVAALEGQSGKTAQALLTFKANAKSRIDELDRINNLPLVNFFGKDYNSLSAENITDALNKADKQSVELLGRVLKRSNPDAFQSLRQTVFDDFMRGMVKGTDEGRPIYDFEKLSDPNVIKQLRTNPLLKAGGESVELAKTLETLAKVQRKYEPAVAGYKTETAGNMQNKIKGLLTTARAVSYRGAIVAQGLLTALQGTIGRNPRTLALFNKTEQRMIRDVLNGKDLTQKDAEKLAMAMDRNSRLLVTAAGLPATSQLTEAQSQAEQAPPTQREAMMQQLQQAVGTGGTPESAESMPIAP